MVAARSAGGWAKENGREREGKREEEEKKIREMGGEGWSAVRGKKRRERNPSGLGLNLGQIGQKLTNENILNFSRNIKIAHVI